MKNFLLSPDRRYFSIVIPIFVSIALLFSSCSSKKPAIGNDDEIIVFADSTEFLNIESTLLKVFGKIIYTPQPEALFYLTRKNLSELEKYKNRKNIIFIAPLNSNSDVSDFINGFLDDKIKDLVKNDSLFIVNRKNLWADDQLVLFLTSTDSQRLDKNISDSSEDLVHYFQKVSDDRLFKSLYDPRFENRNIEAQLLKDFGWMIYVQEDYTLAEKDSLNNFIWVRRSPNKEKEFWIFVHWIDNASPDMLNRDSVTAVRNKLTKKYYRSANNMSSVEISDDYKTVAEVNFLKRYALMTQGLWRMKDGSMGGPFINYSFYDKPTKRLYMLDGSLFAPKFYKKQLIQQVDVLLQSFLTEREVNPRKKTDLMEVLN